MRWFHSSIHIKTESQKYMYIISSQSQTQPAAIFVLYRNHKSVDQTHPGKLGWSCSYILRETRDGITSSLEVLGYHKYLLEPEPRLDCENVVPTRGSNQHLKPRKFGTQSTNWGTRLIAQRPTCVYNTHVDICVDTIPRPLPNPRAIPVRHWGVEGGIETGVKIAPLINRDGTR